jgi:hypothetical protein
MNIAEILYECPSDTKLYSSIFGELSLLYVLPCLPYPIYCKVIRSGSTVSFTEDGKRNITDAEPTLFPSKDQRDWSKFGVSEQDTNTRPKTQFKPFEKVLVRDGDQYEWQCNFFSGMDKENFYLCVSARWEQCIPYEGNEHLLGTTNKPE